MPLVAKTLWMGVENGGKCPNLSDSDPRLQFQTLFGQGVTNSQTPSASKSASNFLTRNNLIKVREYSGTTC